jgi:hypothetical protein
MAPQNTAAKLAPYYPMLTDSQIRERVAAWRLPESRPLPSAPNGLKLKNIFFATLDGFANLIDLIPPRKARDVGMPALSPEEAVREAWSNAGRSLFSAADKHPILSHEEIKHL